MQSGVVLDIFFIEVKTIEQIFCRWLWEWEVFWATFSPFSSGTGKWLKGLCHEKGFKEYLNHKVHTVHARLRVSGRGSPNSDDWRKSLVLCLLCDLNLKISRFRLDKGQGSFLNCSLDLIRKKLKFLSGLMPKVHLWLFVCQLYLITEGISNAAILTLLADEVGVGWGGGVGGAN
jgi:hypothetical protein